MQTVDTVGELRKLLSQTPDDASLVLCLTSGDQYFVSLAVCDAWGYDQTQLKHRGEITQIFIQPADLDGPVECIALDDVPSLLEHCAVRA